MIMHQSGASSTNFVLIVKRNGNLGKKTKVHKPVWRIVSSSTSTCKTDQCSRVPGIHRVWLHFILCRSKWTNFIPGRFAHSTDGEFSNCRWVSSSCFSLERHSNCNDCNSSLVNMEREHHGLMGHISQGMWTWSSVSVSQKFDSPYQLIFDWLVPKMVIKSIRVSVFDRWCLKINYWSHTACSSYYSLISFGAD